MGGGRPVFSDQHAGRFRCTGHGVHGGVGVQRVGAVGYTTRLPPQRRPRRHGGWVAVHRALGGPLGSTTFDPGLRNRSGRRDGVVVSGVVPGNACRIAAADRPGHWWSAGQQLCRCRRVRQQEMAGTGDQSAIDRLRPGRHGGRIDRSADHPVHGMACGVFLRWDRHAHDPSAAGGMVAGIPGISGVSSAKGCAAQGQPVACPGSVGIHRRVATDPAVSASAAAGGVRPAVFAGFAAFHLADLVGILPGDVRLLLRDELDPKAAGRRRLVQPARDHRGGCC